MKRTGLISTTVWTAATLPTATRTAAGWRFGDAEPARWDRAPPSAVLEMLSDLATYGLIGGACSIGKDILAWPESRFAEGRGSFPRLATHEPASFPANAVRAEFVATPADTESEVPGYALLAGARSAASRLRLPFVSTALLTLISRADPVGMGMSRAKPQVTPDLVVPFPLVDPRAFAMQLKPPIRRALAAQHEVLRERRRLVLGLAVGVSDALLDAKIETQLVLPLARRYLSENLGVAAQSIYLVGSGEAAELAPLAIAVTQFDPGEPTGENVFALTLRRLFFQNPRTTTRRYFDISPLALRRRIEPSMSCGTGAGHAMLAALQMEFLESNLPARG
jgi:hypothetical protein